ncbi:MAG: NAD(P)H-hydrate dehydratase [Gammaproteobacteria bacterium]|nr:NAD(P)H-hydrate dehydratase [Gammaproteobacteria bacterium]
MQSLPTNIYSVASVREMDRRAIEDRGVPGYTLMQRAGAAALCAARTHYPDAKRWQVICGSGNNGGDGYVVARLAAQDGIVVSVLSLVDPDALTGDAAKAHADFAAEGGIVMPWGGELDGEAELLVDAILGSGLERELGGSHAAAVAAINRHGADVHAMDIATGIHGDTGAVMGSAVKAALTTTFVGLKAGLFLGSGPNYCGHITFSDLEIGDEILSGIPPLFRRMDDKQLATLLPPRPRVSHKGDFGHVLVVGGGPGMAGAARLCGEAALRAGAGRVSVATHPAHAALICAARPELMSHAISSGKDISELIEKVDVIAFGPGLGQSDWARELYALVSASGKPAVWDADALNLLAGAQHSAAQRVMTPHPGEAAGLLGISAADVQADRPAALKALSAKYGGIIVLKGAGTLISSASGVPFVCTAGNPGMAAPGMGDALTGVIAALLAQGLSLQDAAAGGVELHARAGDAAAAAGERGMLASDLIAALPGIANP